MQTEEHKQKIINNLKQIISTAQNNIDALYADQLEYKHAEDGMNYIRLCTQKVQWHFKMQLDPNFGSSEFIKIINNE
jgi:hypothetical protein